MITNDRHSAAKRRFDDGGDWASAALAEGLGARIGAAATFVTTEHFNLQTARAVTVSEANGRATIYLAALSSNLIALAFIGQMSRLGVAFYAFALILLPVLAFVGVVTFLRLVQSSIEDIAYAHRIGLLRSFYLGVAPELEPYLVVVRKTRSAAPSDGERLAPSAWQLTLTAAGMVAVVNSVVMAASLVQALQRDTRQQSNGGQHEEHRRRQCHFDGGCGTQDDRHGARGSDVARLRCRSGNRRNGPLVPSAPASRPALARQGGIMTHNQIVAALHRGYQLDDARESRRDCYPIRKPAPRTTVRRMWDDRLPSDKPDSTGFGEGCVI